MPDHSTTPVAASDDAIRSGSDRTGSASPSLIATINTLLRYRFLIVGIPFLVGCFVLVMRVVQGSTYIATAKVVPEGGASEASRLAGLASQFGIALPRTGDRESLEFYAELIKSEDLLRGIVTSRYHLGAEDVRDSTGSTLVELYKSSGPDEAERIRRAIITLRLNINVLMDPKANIITLVVSAKDPGLAVQLNRRILNAINTYNLQRRQSRATAERVFVEARQREALRELTDAETAMRNFLDANHQFRGSAQLTMEEARLQRRVDMRQQVYSSLSQAYEQARIEEVRNTPVITVVDRPEGSVRRNNRLLTRLLLALAPAIALAVALTFAHDYLRRQRVEDPDEYARFVEMRRRLLPGRRRRRSAAPPDRSS
jgi:uncharacterized protein involved in exopolysaccharide biosynthesis